MPSPTKSGRVTHFSITGPTEELALVGGSKWGAGLGTGATVTYSFPWLNTSTATWDQGSHRDQELSWEPSGFRETEAAYARLALQVYSMYINVNVKEVADTASNVGDIRFARASLPVNGQLSTLGEAYLPNGSASGGDVWISSSDSRTDNIAPGYIGYFTLLHELGHALGLKHPFEGNVRLPTELDNSDMTIMSYTEGYYGNATTVSPMALDIQALQTLYGANNNFRSGDDSYSYETLVSMFGLKPKYPQQPAGAAVATLWDAGGNDTFVVSGGLGMVDLRPFSTRALPGRTAIAPTTFTGPGTNDGSYLIEIAKGVVIENVVTRHTGVQIWGNDADNVLQGTTLGSSIGYSGVQIHAGSGNDKLYADMTICTEPGKEPGGPDQHLTSNRLYGEDGNDEIFGFMYGDALVGGNGNDRLFGLSGDDGMMADFGDDFVDGGDGVDGLEFYDPSSMPSRSEVQITQKLDGSYQVKDLRPGSPLGTDTVFDVEWFDFTGSPPLHMEHQLTDSDDNYNYDNSVAGLGKIILGGAGDDTITQTGSANDRLDGGAGNDTLTGGSGNNVYVLDNPTDMIIEQPNAGIDTVWAYFSYSLQSNLENVVLRGRENINATGDGSDNLLGGNIGNNAINGLGGADTLAGNDGNDTLDGGSGIDYVYGGVGNDHLIGGIGKDTLQGGNGLIGGAGDDAFIYMSTAEGGDTILDFSSFAIGNDDSFEFEGHAFGHLNAGTLKASRLQVSQSNHALSAGVRFFFESDTDILRFDPDGDGSKKCVIVATLEHGATMSSQDVWII